MSPSRTTGLLGFFMTLLFLAPFVHGRVFEAGNDASRFAQIESLVDHGETWINSSRYHWTVDRVTIDGRDYSNKPPLLSLIGSAVYWSIQRVAGVTLAQNESFVVYLLVFMLAALPTAWLVALFHRSLTRWWGPRETATSGAAPIGAITLVTAALAAGTILTSFSTTLNNHTIAAVFLFAACDAAWSGEALAAGLFVSLTGAIDTVPGLLFAPALAILVRDTAGRRGLLRYGGALLVGVLLFVGANLYVVGSPWPAKMVPGAVDYSSRMGPSVAGVLLPVSWAYPLSALFGWHGFFTVSPVLLFGAVGMVVSARVGDPLPRRWIILLGSACVAMIAGHALFVGSYGGWSYGFRYLIPIIPLLLFFAPAALGPSGKRLFVPVLAVSCLCALLGAYHPWPPVDEPGTGRHPVASVVTNPVGASLAAWLRQYSPAGLFAGTAGSLFISPERESRDRYLALFYATKGDTAMARRIAAEDGPP